MTLPTQDLIKILSQSETAGKPPALSMIALTLMVASFAMTWLILQRLRPELMALAPPPGFFIKTAILLGFALTGILYLQQAAKPVPVYTRLPLLLIPLMMLAFFMGLEWNVAPSLEYYKNLVLLPNFLSCIAFVSSYGLVGITVLTLALKRYAPADENRAAGLVGFTAASACGLGYSFHCPIDSPTFIATAYGIPVALLWIFARFAVPKFIRW